MKRSLAIALGFSVLVACAPTARFARYTDSSFPSTTEVEVLRTKPADRPYIELGEIRLQLKKSNEDDAILVLKEKAKEVGADAMVILGEQSRGTAILPMGGMAFAVPLRDLVAVAIRYKHQVGGSPRYILDQARCLLTPSASQLHAAVADLVNFLKDQTLVPDVKKWSEVQGQIWSCELCRGHERVACNIRQQTEAPNCSVKLLLIGVAPPYVRGIATKSIAKSATNDDDDNIRKFFVMATLRLSWDALFDRGLFMVHGVKCAIVPKDRHQNPPDDVVDACAPRHLADELKHTMPLRIVVFGGAPYRALVKVPGIKVPKGLGVSKRVGDLVAETKGGVEIQADGWTSRMHVSPFPLNGKKPNPDAAEVLREAARLSGVLR